MPATTENSAAPDPHWCAIVRIGLRTFGMILGHVAFARREDLAPARSRLPSFMSERPKRCRGRADEAVDHRGAEHRVQFEAERRRRIAAIVPAESA